MMCNFTEKIMIINLLIFLNFSPCWHIINSAPKFYKVLQKHCMKKQTRHQPNPEQILNLKPQKIWVQNVLAIITYPTRVVCIVQGPPIGKNALPVKQEVSCLFTSGLTGSQLMDFRFNRQWCSLNVIPSFSVYIVFVQVCLFLHIIQANP